MPRITWPQFKKEVEVPVGTTILDAALDHNIPLEHACGGFCACTTCHLHVKEGLENLSPLEDMERDRLEGVDYLSDNSRLGCQAQIRGDLVLEIPSLNAE